MWPYVTTVSLWFVWTLSLCNIETVLMNSPLCAYSGETFSDVKVKLNTMLQVYML